MNINHWQQLIATNNFQLYDYGPIGKYFPLLAD